MLSLAVMKRAMKCAMRSEDIPRSVLKPFISIKMGRSGFSLIELLISLSVFAFGILGVIGMQMYALRGNSYSWNSTLAQRLVEQKLEYLKGERYTYATMTTFGTIQLNQDSVPVADRLAETANDTVRVDIEGYGQLKESPAVFYANPGGNVPASPYDRFERITIQKIVNGALGTDNRMVVRVIVYWVGPGSDPATLSTHKKIAMQGMVAL